VVVGIFTALVLILGASFQGWMAKYKVEDDTKRLFTALSTARLQAMQRKRAHFVVIDNAAFRTLYTVEDSSPAPDGDGARTAQDRTVDTVATSFRIVPALTGGVTEFSFDRNGIPSVSGTLSLQSTFSPDYDCITIDVTRIKMGRMDGGACREK